MSALCTHAQYCDHILCAIYIILLLMLGKTSVTLNILLFNSVGSVLRVFVTAPH